MLTLKGQLLANRYRIGNRLGSGGMGEVYEGVQEDLGRPVAVKVMSGAMASDPTLLERFQREARAVAALGHPHIVSVTDFQDNPGEPPFLVMERLVGESLGDLLEREPMIDPMRACRIAEQTLSALAAAHEAGLVHRDVKPDNIFLCRSDTAPSSRSGGGGEIVKLLDFGVAKAMEETQHGKLTNTGAIVGTLVYMAPEQARGEPVDARADIYAIGAVLYHMLAGQTPFQSESPARLLSDVANARPMPLASLRPDLDGSLLAIIARAMEPVVEHRYPNARAMMAQLGALLRGEVPKTEPVFVHAPTQFGTPIPTPRTGGATPYPQHYPHPTSGAGVVVAPYAIAPSAPPPARSSGLAWAVAATMFLFGAATVTGTALWMKKKHMVASTAKTTEPAPVDLAAAAQQASSAQDLAPLSTTGGPVATGVSATPTTLATNVAPTTLNTAATSAPTVSLSGLSTGQLIQQMVKAHTQGDGRTCLDAYDKLKAQPDFSDPANGYAIIHGDCLMAAGRCDEGRKMVRDYYNQPRPALTQMSSTQIETSVSSMAMIYCPASQLTPAERLSRGQQLLYKAEGSHDTATAARYADEMASQLGSAPQSTPEDRRKLVGYEFAIGKAYAQAGRCAEARKHFLSECGLNNASNPDLCANGLGRANGCTQP